MMNRFIYKKYFFIGAALFLLLSLPSVFVEHVRGKMIASFSFFFKGLNSCVKNKVSDSERLEAENHLLRIEINKLRALLEQKAKTEKLDEELKKYTLTPRRYQEMHFLADVLHQAIPARIIYRDPNSWSSSVWVNVGEETNQILNRCVIQKNSPAILGRALVGAVDYVGKKQSRIRLLTDIALKPSVRAVRGLPQNSALIDQIDPVLLHLHARNDLPLSATEKDNLLKGLDQLKGKLSVQGESWYLAKGIVQGGGTPMYRRMNHTLKGIGFNYDFSDEEGPARELETGKAIASEKDLCTMPILKIHDLLVTTGMDGVFPAGLRVAEVTKIFPLREGSYTYEIEASALVGNLDTLHTIFIIPPMGYEEEN